ncbi:hypothetical protein ABZZ80_46605 [Streptomyces sp. NPDC006356]
MARPDIPGSNPHHGMKQREKTTSKRQTKRGQLNYAVPEVLQLQRRIRRCNADTDIPHGDIVALALDSWLRSRGYPPDSKDERRKGLDVSAQ